MQQRDGGAMTDTAITGYAHVNVVVDDLDSACDFYGNKLGLQQIPRPDFGGFPGAWFRLGAAQLHLSAVDRMPEWNGTAPHLAIHIAPGDFVPAVERLKAAGVELTSDVRTREDFGVTVQTAFCRDPAGNLIELTDVAPFD